jgi:hypothetical protein
VLVPDPAYALPGNTYRGEKVVSLYPSVVSCDVREFTELLNRAEELKPTEAIEAYEAALARPRSNVLLKACVERSWQLCRAAPDAGLVDQNGLSQGRPHPLHGTELDSQ